MQFRNASYWVLVLMVLVFNSCKQEGIDPSEENNFLTISESLTDNGVFKVKMLAADTLFHGYNKVYFDIVTAGDDATIESGFIGLYPEMDMITMRHSAPYEAPAEFAGEDDLFEAAIVFIMPDTDDMKWRVKVKIESGSLADSVWLPIPKVKALEEPKILNFISAIDGTKYFVSLVEPAEPKVGINDYEVAIHYKKTMMLFPADEAVSVAIDPQMPSMDHGSPNNVNPVHTELGHYQGKVNFTMTGWWRVFMELEKDGEKLIEEAYLDITF